MYLKKLTLRGFKSFASTTTLVLEPGITCIVGPNGSGKSNVVDALAWVMGEQGAKTLRGASMEDVIFAGTSKRAPLGRAEIQLTIDNTDGALPIDYTEVTISRTKFRNGNSEYAINGATCRLLDVRELLSDSGIGREMHVIVGQGHLEQILQATPETRRGFVEEAAGVLKHRERKEKALRKLDATEANLHRLTDLLAEIRRQLKPLGRQAEVARRATAVQADLRDAKARLLADDLVQATSELATELADEQSVREQRRAAEAGLAAARTEEDESRAAAVAAEGAYRRIQETWFALAGVGERVRSVVTLAGERVRVAEALPPETPNPARDPETLLAQAAKVADDEARLRTEIDARAARLTEATAARTAAETAHAAAERAFEVLVRANSDRREGLARLSGQLATLKTRLEAGAARLQQLRAAVAAADEKALVADREHADRQASLPDLEAGEHDLDSAYEAAAGVAEAAKAGVEARRGDLRALTERRAGLVARAEALRLAARAADDGAAWLAAQDLPGVQGPLATMIRVEPGYERAVAAALGPVVEAVVVGDLGASVAAVAALTAAERGRAGLVVAGGTAVVPPRSVMAVVTGDAGVLAALTSLIGEVRLAETLAEARGLAEAGATVVTPDGAYLSPRLVWGGSDSHQSAIQLAAALADAEAELVVVDDDVARGEAGLAAAEARSLEADAALAAAIRALTESDAA
ncbi:MAG: AAA family ATPase, partial [Propionibacteriaceae bacterium]|nr:AAA family ATPase [Propionibacteriaceae bacterium]